MGESGLTPWHSMLIKPLKEETAIFAVRSGNKGGDSMAQPGLHKPKRKGFGAVSSAYMAIKSTSFHQSRLWGRVVELYLILFSSKYVFSLTLGALCCWASLLTFGEVPETSSWLPSTKLWCNGLRTTFLYCPELPGWASEQRAAPCVGRAMLACASHCAVLQVSGELNGHSCPWPDLFWVDQCRQLGDLQAGLILWRWFGRSAWY